MAGALRLMAVAPDDIETWLVAQSKAQAKRIRENGGTPGADTPVVPVPVATAAVGTPAAPRTASGLPDPAVIGGAP